MQRASMALLFIISAGLIMGLQLFCHPIVGIADNTDFRRISTQVGISPSADENTLFKYANLTYSFCPRQKVEYVSSEAIFCNLARVMNRTLVSKEYFDIRCLGLVQALTYLVALYLFAYSMPMPARSLFIFLACNLFIWTDVCITSYFNSFYSESASVIILLLTLGVMVLMGAKDSSRAWRWIYRAGFLLLSLLLAFSKSQHLIMLIILWGFGVCCTWPCLPSTSMRWAWVLGTAVLLFGGMAWGLKSNAYAETKVNNIRIVLATEIKPHSPDYDRDLQEMNATRDDISRVTLRQIVMFYARHPQRYLELLERRAQKAFSHLGFGNYCEAESRQPWEQSSKFNLWWQFKERHYPKHLWFIAGILASGLLIGGGCRVKSRTAWIAHLGLVNMTLAVMAAGAFLIAATFEANGPEKHLFLFNVLFDEVSALSVFLLGLSWWGRRATAPTHAAELGT